MKTKSIVMTVNVLVRLNTLTTILFVWRLKSFVEKYFCSHHGNGTVTAVSKVMASDLMTGFGSRQRQDICLLRPFTSIYC